MSGYDHYHLIQVCVRSEVLRWFNYEVQIYLHRVGSEQNDLQALHFIKTLQSYIERNPTFPFVQALTLI